MSDTSKADEAFDLAWSAFKQLEAQHAASFATAAEHRAKADALDDQRHAAMLDVLAAMPASSRIPPAKLGIIQELTDRDTIETVKAKLQAIDLEASIERIAAVKAELNASAATLAPVQV